LRRIAVSIVATITGLVLLLSFKTHGLGGTTAPAAALASPTGSSTPAATTGSGKAKHTSKSSAKHATATTSPTHATVSTTTGDAVQTRYGPVQVRITVKDGKLTRVEPTEYPQTEPRDVQINDYAIPMLDREALAAGAATIDVVSGATFTSDGYISSLQSALDKAGL
jgi:uncharacterized protein with FMN-binding domain